MDWKKIKYKQLFWMFLIIKVLINLYKIFIKDLDKVLMRKNFS